MGNRRSSAAFTQKMMGHSSSTEGNEKANDACSPQFSVESVPARSLSSTLLRKGMTLNALVWPVKVPVNRRVEKRQRESRQDSEVMSQMTWHFIREGGAIIAMARTFRRVITEVSGQHFPVLALAGVCTHPHQRGRGLGRAVVWAAWSLLQADLHVCFFQTGVPAFYERMGARTVTNLICDSTGARGFWDPHAMIYPATAAWPAGELDLLGGGW